MELFKNPFRPGAGHLPPYLAGRETESSEFKRLLTQDTIFENLILTGLRGIGKTVLLESLKPIAIENRWLWVGTDLSESLSVTEDKLALRILTDLSVVTSNWPISMELTTSAGFMPTSEVQFTMLNFQTLVNLYNSAPGLPSDKLKLVLEKVWQVLPKEHFKGIIFAYDEAQSLFDRSDVDQYSLSLLLDVFQSIQRKNIPFMLVLVGLPTLFPNLVEARTYSERMFRVLFLDRLNKEESKRAILQPIEDHKSPVRFDEGSVETIVSVSGGYPYFIQFICKEVFDIFLQKAQFNQNASVPVDEIIHKLDSDFFAGRWSRTTDRQKELLHVAALVTVEDDQEFSVQEVVKRSSGVLKKPLSGSYANQILTSLIKIGLVYKNRHGKYSFAVPMLGKYILRQIQQGEGLDL